jgi:hypothetical protein
MVRKREVVRFWKFRFFVVDMGLLGGYEYDNYTNCRPSFSLHDDILLLLAAVCVGMAKLRRGRLCRAVGDRNLGSFGGA